MQTAEKNSKPWTDILKVSIPFAGVPSEDIWQAVHGTKPLRYGTQRAVCAFEPWKDFRETCVRFAGVPTEDIWQAVQLTITLKSGA